MVDTNYTHCVAEFQYESSSTVTVLCTPNYGRVAPLSCVSTGLNIFYMGELFLQAKATVIELY